LGTPHVTTYRRWGLYTGLGVSVGDGTILGTLGKFRSGPSGFDTGSTRGDLVWSAPLFGGLGPRLGVSLSDPEGRASLDWEGSIGLVGAL
jgi:hypothetical protein